MALPAEEPREVHPLKMMHPGQDTLDADGNVVFSDFRPGILPANAPEPEPVTSPKVSSVPASVNSLESQGQMELDLGMNVQSTVPKVTPLNKRKGH